MDNLLFSVRKITSNINYRIDNSNYEIHNIEIIKDQILKYKNTEQYMHAIINYIKDNIIKSCTDLKLVKIVFNIYDQKNIIHQFILTISNIIADLLNLKTIIENDLNKSLIIYIIYDEELIFSGSYDFSHLFYK
jgi:hypothetical protein